MTGTTMTEAARTIPFWEDLAAVASERTVEPHTTLIKKNFFFLGEEWVLYVLYSYPVLVLGPISTVIVIHFLTP